jgi:hypothetical protein
MLTKIYIVHINKITCKELFHATFLDTLICLNAKFLIFGWNGSLIILFKLKSKHRFCVTATLLFYILQEYDFIRSTAVKKESTFQYCNMQYRSYATIARRNVYYLVTAGKHQ